MLTITALAATSVASFGMAIAQAPYDYQGSRYTAQAGRFEECQAWAADVTGYRGPRPQDYRPSGALRGAVRGAVTSGIIAGVVGGNSKRAARRGAVAGAVVGSVRRIEQEKQFDRQRAYRVELDRCMTGAY